MITGAIFMVFIMAKALAPNFGAALVFHFLTGLFGSTPLTCAGGSIADLWSPLEATFSLPFLTIVSYVGPMVGPVISAYMGESSLISWRWAEWIMLIFAGLVMALVFLFQPETYEPLLLSWKAAEICNITGDDRFKSESEATEDSSLWIRLQTSIYRPFLFTYTEPIIMLFTLYLIIIYIVLYFYERLPFHLSGGLRDFAGTEQHPMGSTDLWGSSCASLDTLGILMDKERVPGVYI